MSEPFPAGFVWGVATSSHQIEGALSADGRGESIWDTFARIPGAIADGSTGDPACDHYRRWRDDLDLMASLGVAGYRFSIAWPRVLPDGAGSVNRAGLDFYRALCEGLRERGIEPLATLYHWDLPQALEDAGGWRSRETAGRFAEYAAVVADGLGDLVGRWITHNEPWCSAFLGHGWGRKAPGVRDWAAALQVSHHLLLSHGLAAQALRAARPGALVGIAPNLDPFEPATDAPEDVAAARRLDGLQNRWFLDPVLRGGYPEDTLAEVERRYGPLDVRAGDVETIAQPLDFLGVNYYHRSRVRHAPGSPPLDVAALPPEGETTAMGWPITPGGLYDVLARLRDEYGNPPVYVTENGAAFDEPPSANGVVEDPRRVEYLRRHLAELRRAVAGGADVRGYYLWSLLDNWEWEHGYEKRFGIVYVDYATQRRIPKRSALWYRDVIARNALESSR